MHYMDTLFALLNPCEWIFVSGIYQTPVIFPHKGQKCGTRMLSLLSTWTTDCKTVELLMICDVIKMEDQYIFLFQIKWTHLSCLLTWISRVLNSVLLLFFLLTLPTGIHVETDVNPTETQRRIYASVNYTTIGSENCLVPVRRQTIIRMSIGLLSEVDHWKSISVIFE